MPRRPIKKITVAEVELIAFELARKLMEWNEPIPDFETRFPLSLESCLETPFQTFDRKSLYKGLVAKASIMFYLMIKNHPFQNGNKRIAVTTLLVFLISNHRVPKATNEEIYEFARNVAESKPEDKDIQMKKINEFIGSMSEEV